MIPWILASIILYNYGVGSYGLWAPIIPLLALWGKTLALFTMNPGLSVPGGMTVWPDRHQWGFVLQTVRQIWHQIDWKDGWPLLLIGSPVSLWRGYDPEQRMHGWGVLVVSSLWLIGGLWVQSWLTHLRQEAEIYNAKMELWRRGSRVPVASEGESVEPNGIGKSSYLMVYDAREGHRVRAEIQLSMEIPAYQIPAWCTGTLSPHYGYPKHNLSTAYPLCKAQTSQDEVYAGVVARSMAGGWQGLVSHWQLPFGGKVYQYPLDTLGWCELIWARGWFSTPDQRIHLAKTALELACRHDQQWLRRPVSAMELINRPSATMQRIPPSPKTSSTQPVRMTQVLALTDQDAPAIPPVSKTLALTDRVVPPTPIPDILGLNNPSGYLPRMQGRLIYDFLPQHRCAYVKSVSAARNTQQKASAQQKASESSTSDNPTPTRPPARQYTIPSLAENTPDEARNASLVLEAALRQKIAQAFNRRVYSLEGGSASEDRVTVNPMLQYMLQGHWSRDISIGLVISAFLERIMGALPVYQWPIHLIQNLRELYEHRAIKLWPASEVPPFMAYLNLRLHHWGINPIIGPASLILLGVASTIGMLYLWCSILPLGVGLMGWFGIQFLYHQGWRDFGALRQPWEIWVMAALVLAGWAYWSVPGHPLQIGVFNTPSVALQLNKITPEPDGSPGLELPCEEPPQEPSSSTPPPARRPTLAISDRSNPEADPA